MPGRGVRDWWNDSAWGCEGMTRGIAGGGRPTMRSNCRTNLVVRDERLSGHRCEFSCAPPRFPSMAGDFPRRWHGDGCCGNVASCQPSRLQHVGAWAVGGRHSLQGPRASSAEDKLAPCELAQQQCTGTIRLSACVMVVPSPWTVAATHITLLAMSKNQRT